MVTLEEEVTRAITFVGVKAGVDAKVLGAMCHEVRGFLRSAERGAQLDTCFRELEELRARVASQGSAQTVITDEMIEAGHEEMAKQGIALDHESPAIQVRLVYQAMHTVAPRVSPLRDAKPKACENGCPPQTVCDYCQGVGGSNPQAEKTRQYGDAFEFWWQGRCRGDYISRDKDVAWEAWKASASRSSDSPHRLPTSATGERRRFEFDRLRAGVVMAEGIAVDAASLEEATIKASTLLEKRYPSTDTIHLRAGEQRLSTVAVGKTAEASDDDIRAAFDAWCDRNVLTRKRLGDGYKSPHADWCWRAFYSATRLAESWRSATAGGKQ